MIRAKRLSENVFLKGRSIVYSGNVITAAENRSSGSRASAVGGSRGGGTGGEGSTVRFVSLVCTGDQDRPRHRLGGAGLYENRMSHARHGVTRARGPARTRLRPRVGPHAVLGMLFVQPFCKSRRLPAQNWRLTAALGVSYARRRRVEVPIL